MPKRKPGTGPKPSIVPPERYPSGDPKPAVDAVNPTAPTIIKRLKDHLIPKAKDKRLGTVLGLMHLEGILTEAEVEAGFAYAEDVGAFDRISKAPARAARSPSYDGGFRGGMEVDLEALKRMDPDAAKKVERRIRHREKQIEKRYDRAQAIIPTFPIIASTIVEEVCCNDRRVHSVHHPGLKQILRNLARHYGIAVDAVQRPRTSRKVDAALLAQGAVDAIETHFERRKATVSTYRLAPAVRGVTPAITAYGEGAIETVEHTIRFKRSGLMIEEITFQLVKAAEEKGWKPAQRPERDVA